MNRRWLALAVTAVMLSPSAMSAQAGGTTATIDARGPRIDQDTVLPAASGLRPLRVAKWSTLAVATAAGIYGFVENSRADDRFRELESMCETQRMECLRRTAGGSYENEAFETLFQSVRRHDRRAHTALVAGQIGVAASVVFFLLDLGNVRPPDDIPWTPGLLRLERASGVTRLGFHLSL